MMYKADEAGELERFFFDRVELYAKSGPGGDGALSSVMGRPAGGCGGNGGCVVIECSDAYNTLTHLQGGRFRAERGAEAKARASGTNGEDIVLRVPQNCAITLRDTNETLATLVKPGDRYLVFYGGQGGKGNGVSGSPGKVLPPGGAKGGWLTLQMTLIADVGLVGLPNAGKSTLLRAVSKARPKVANYPFTTLVPNLGVCEGGLFGLDERSYAMVWLDIPGLIEGAADGKGLGLAFLRHTERCRILLHLIDGESEFPEQDFLTINQELAAYSPGLAATPQAVVLTKSDLPHVAADLSKKLEALKAVVGHARMMAISSADGSNLKDLLIRTKSLLQREERSAAAKAILLASHSQSLGRQARARGLKNGAAVADRASPKPAEQSSEHLN